jgi:hypothetical protein
MNMTLFRLLTRPVAFALFALGVLFTFSVFIPYKLGQVEMLQQVAGVFASTGEWVSIGMLAWAMGDLLIRCWHYRQWELGRVQGCPRCGGPTLPQWERHRPVGFCLSCGRKSRL